MGKGLGKFSRNQREIFMASACRKLAKSRMVLGVLHEFGTVLHIVWCPYGIYDPASAASSDKNRLTRLGAFAIAAASGAVAVFWSVCFRLVAILETRKGSF